MQEFIALAKSKPGQLNFASSGVGANTHLSAELFNGMVGSKMNHIPYKGSGVLVTDLISGRVELSFQVPITVMNYITSGRLKASPPASMGLSRKSPITAPRGRVRMNAAQNKAVYEIRVR